MRNNRIFICLFLFLLSTTIKSQECNYKIDSVYFVNISGQLKNGRPVFTQIVINNLDTLKNFIYNEKEEFLCKVFNSAIFVTEPYTGFLEMNKCLSNAEKELIDFNRKIKRFNKKCIETITFPNKQYNNLHLSIIKTVSEFWFVPFDIKQVNDVSESIKISPECYKTPYYYKFKKIIEIIPLSKKERDSFYHLK